MLTITNKAMVQNTKLDLYRENSTQPPSATTVRSNVLQLFFSVNIVPTRLHTHISLIYHRSYTIFENGSVVQKQIKLAIWFLFHNLNATKRRELFWEHSYIKDIQNQ